MTEKISFSAQKHFVLTFMQQIDCLGTPGAPYERTSLGVYQTEAKKGDTAGLKALVRELISDILEISSDWPPERLQAVDATMQQAGAPKLSDIRLRHSKKVKKIIAKGSISSSAEYYEAKEVVDSRNALFTADERNLLESAMLRFEEKA